MGRSRQHDDHHQLQAQGTNWSTNPIAPIAGGQSARFGAAGNINVNVGSTIAPDLSIFNANSKSFIVTGSAVNFGNAATLTNNASNGAGDFDQQ